MSVPFVAVEILDAGLELFEAACDQINLCSAEPTDYATAVSLARGVVTVDASDFTIGSTTNGRQISLAETVVPGVDITSTGLVTHLAFVDTSSSELLATTIAGLVRTNTAQAGASTTITLDVGASAEDNSYVGYAIIAAGQKRYITAYNGTTKVATVNASWTSNPDSSTQFRLFGQHVTTGQNATIQPVVAMSNIIQGQ